MLFRPMEKVKPLISPWILDQNKNIEYRKDVVTGEVVAKLFWSWNVCCCNDFVNEITNYTGSWQIVIKSKGWTTSFGNENREDAIKSAVTYLKLYYTAYDLVEDQKIETDNTVP